MSVLPRMAHASPFSGRSATAFLQLDDGIVELAELHVQDAQRVGRILQLGVHLPGAAQFRNRILRPVFELVGEPQIVVKLRIVGIERESLLEVVNRLIEGRKLNVADTQILVDRRILRVLGQGALEVVERLFAFAGEGQRQVQGW